MTKILKKRFIIFTMTAVTILLVFLVLAINSLVWIMMDQKSDSVLRMLVEADGAFHRMDFERRPPFLPPLDMDKMRGSRFFMVDYDGKGNILDINIDQISAIDQERAKTYALEVVQSGKKEGRIDGYKYAVDQKGMKQRIFFIDISEEGESFLMVFLSSSAIAVLCWIFLLMIVILLSGKVVYPVLIGMEKQKQFITNAGHEMKTPLAIIQSNNDAMSLIYGENKYNVHIRNQTKRLNGLMSNLLTLARLDEETLLPTETVNIGELIKEIVPVYKEEARVRKLKFAVHTQPELFLLIHKDSFFQMITILLDNAVKYTSEGGEIYLSLMKEGKYIYIIEENDCEFFLESNPERLFERFYRGDTARTQKREDSGYGIGLSAARAICENFGGKLTAEYLEEKRIRFTARF